MKSKGIEILRPGAITAAQIRKDFPGIEVVTSEVEDHIQAPGQLKSHYSPVKPLYLVDKAPDCLQEGSALMVFDPLTYKGVVTPMVHFLSANGDLIEAASNMFTVLHQLEADQNINRILAVKVREEGIGLAIMDRLKKAAFRFSAIENYTDVVSGCS